MSKTAVDQDKTFRRWIEEELPARYGAYMKDPSIGVPAKDVRARFEAKRTSQTNRG